MNILGFNITRQPIQKLLNIPRAKGWYFKVGGIDEDYEISDNYNGFEKAYGEQVWVQRCINLIASSVASVPIRLYKYEGGKKSEETGHPIVNLLADVNPLTMNASDLWKATVIALKVYGNSYWYLERRGKEEPQELYWLNPGRVEIFASKNPDGFIDHYDYTTNNTSAPIIRYNAHDIIQFKYFNPSNDYYGLSPISSIREAVSADLYAQAWNKYFFRNAARIDGFCKIKGSLTTEQRELLEKAIKQKYGGVKKAHQVPVLDEDTDYVKIGTDPKDAEWNELRRMCREAICSALGVPPVLVVAYEAANYATAYEQKKSLWHETIVPELHYFEEVLNWNLLPQFKNTENMKLEFDLSNVMALQEEASSTYERLFRACGVPFLSKNEARNFLGLSPVDGGDKLYEPLNMVEAGQE